MKDIDVGDVLLHTLQGGAVLKANICTNTIHDVVSLQNLRVPKSLLLERLSGKANRWACTNKPEREKWNAESFKSSHLRCHQLNPLKANRTELSVFVQVKAFQEVCSHGGECDCVECYRLTANIWEIYFEVDLVDPYIGHSILLWL